MTRSGTPYDLRMLHTDDLCRSRMLCGSQWSSAITLYSVLRLFQWFALRWIFARNKISLFWNLLVVVLMLYQWLFQVFPELFLPLLFQELITVLFLTSYCNLWDHLFSGSGIMIPSFQSLGTSTFCHTWLHNLINLAIISFLPHLSSSDCIPTIPDALPFFIFLITRYTYSVVISPSSISNSSPWTSPKSCVIAGSGQLRIAWKCSSHLIDCSSNDFNDLPSASLIGNFCVVFPEFFSRFYKMFLSYPWQLPSQPQWLCFQTIFLCLLNTCSLLLCLSLSNLQCNVLC